MSQAAMSLCCDILLWTLSALNADAGSPEEHPGLIKIVEDGLRKREETIRKELRSAISQTVFMSIGADIQSLNDDDQDVARLRDRACGFTQFGVNAGLFTPDEGNEWLDAIWGRKTLADVAEKYED